MRGYALVTAGKAEGCTGETVLLISRGTIIASYSAHHTDSPETRRRRSAAVTRAPHAAAVRLRPFPAEVVPTRQVTAFPGNSNSEHTAHTAYG